MATYTLRTHGGRLTRTYWCPDAGGYVREIDDDHPGTLGRQVCDCLDHMGSTLTASERTLARVIRRERARERRWELREGMDVAELRGL